MRTRIATLADANAIAECQCAAFFDDPLFAAIYPHRREYPEEFQRSRAEISRLRLLNKENLTFVTEDEETGRMAGFAMWNRLNSNEPANPHYGLLMELENVLETATQKVTKLVRRNRAEKPGELERLLGSMADAKMKRLKGNETWYLNILAVHPNFQKRGVGKELCLRGMREAEKDGIPTYLEASAKGEGMYRSLGWVDIGRMTDDFGVGVIMAWYPPTTTVRFDVE